LSYYKDDDAATETEKAAATAAALRKVMRGKPTLPRGHVKSR
jgi:hypothetical protein